MFLYFKKKGREEVNRIKVKILGDGIRMLYSSNLFVCLFVLLEEG